MSAEEYVKRVFVPNELPSEMSTCSFLRITMDLLDPEKLKSKITDVLLRKTWLVPRSIKHAGTVTFLSSAVTQGDLSLGATAGDAERIVKACTPLLFDYFSLTKREVIKIRPRLLQCVRDAIVHASAQTRTSRHLLAVACVVAVVLAEEEGITRRTVSYTRIYKSTNLYRYVSLSNLRDIVHVPEEQSTGGESLRGRLEPRTFQIVLDRVVARRRTTAPTTH
jgi:hypothetical protein